jgi:hypothetical protein
VAAAVLVLAEVRAGAAPSQTEIAFTTGKELYRQKRYREAILVLDEALHDAPDDLNLVWMLVKTLDKQYGEDRDPDKLRRCVALLHTFLAGASTGDPNWNPAKVMLADLEPQLVRLEQEHHEPVAPPRRTVLVVSSPVVGAGVTVDTSAVEPSPAVFETTPGIHVVTVAAQGYRTSTTTQTALDGQTFQVNVALEELPSSLRVHGPAHARVAVDGRVLGEIGDELTLASGRHHVTVVMRGHYAWTRDLDLAAGKAIEVDAQLAVSAQRELSRYVIRGGVALLVGGAITTTLAFVAQHDAERLNAKAAGGASLLESERVEYDDAIAHRDAWRTASYVLIGTGLTAAAAGLLMYVVDTPRVEPGAPPPLPPVTPTVQGGGVGVSWQRTF